MTLLLESDLPRFTQYVSTVLAPYVVDAHVDAMVTSRLVWVDAPPSVRVQDTFGVGDWDRRPDRDLYVRGDTAYWLRIDDFPDLQLAVSCGEAGLSLTGRYHFQIGHSRRAEPLRRLRYGHRIEELQTRRFSTLLYYLVYHPILWRLSRFEGWHVLHAGAVADGLRTALFAGMPGCGKSTLVVAMLGDDEWVMLSDNLVLHDGSRLLACPEVLLLDSRSLERAAAGARRLVATGERRVYGRDAYRPDRTVLEPVAPTVVFNVGRARRTELVAIDAETASARLAADNTMAKEVRRVRIMSEVIDMVAGTRAPDDTDALRRLVDAVPCYDLWVEQDGNAREVISAYVMRALASAAVAGGTRA